MLQRATAALRRQVTLSRRPTRRPTRPYGTKDNDRVKQELGRTDAASRIERLESRLPRVLRRFTAPLRRAPVSHITAFLLLHELTAVVPLFGLAGLFHYTQWLPPFISEGKWVSEGVDKFGRWLRKRGWIDGVEEEDARKHQGRTKWWDRGQGGTRIVVEFATAYAVTKALLPLRLPLSVWLTPWFARWTVLPLTTRLKAVFYRSKAARSAGSPENTSKAAEQSARVSSERKTR